MTDYEFEADRDKVLFIDVEVGEMFLDKADFPCVRTFYTELKDGKFNAVRITDGALFYFSENDSVVRIKKAVFTV